MKQTDKSGDSEDGTKDRKAKERSLGDPSGQDICFCIMPFGESFDDYYKTVYRPAIISAGLSPRRADDLYRPSNIVSDIWSYTKQARIILADLSGRNANVFYELGLAHAIAKPAILVADSLDSIPFDLRSLRVLVYDKNDAEWGARLKSSVENSIREILDSPREAVLPTFFSLDESAKATSITIAEKELLELKQNVQYLKREMTGRYGKGLSRPPSVDDQIEGLILYYYQESMPHFLECEVIDSVLEHFDDVPREYVAGKVRQMLRREDEE